MMYGHRRLALALGVWTVVVAGCGRVGDAGAAALNVVDSAGVTIVTSPGAALDRPLDVELAPEPHLRIGTIDGGEETQFTAIASVERLADGRLLVAEAGRQRVRLFSAEGSFLRWIGGVGDGPGEYAVAGAAGILAGDTVWVYDLGRREVEIFTLSGEGVRTFRPEMLEDVRLPRSVSMLPRGEVVAVGSTFGPGPGMEPGDVVEDVVLAVLDREGRGSREITRAPGIHWTVVAGGNERAGLFTAMYDERWRALPEYAAAGETLVHADPGTFEVRRFSLDGALNAIVRVSAPRRPVTDRMIDSYRDALLEAVADDPVRQGTIRQNMAEYAYADSLPHFTDPAIVDDGGAVWLLEYPDPSADSVGFRPMWRIDFERGVEGYLEVPWGLYPRSVDGDELLGFVRDDLGVPYVVAYRLVPRTEP